MVKIFAETFQGCFNDGLGGTKDYRMIPGMIFLCAALVALAVSITSHIHLQVCMALALGCVYCHFCCPCLPQTL